MSRVSPFEIAGGNINYRPREMTRRLPRLEGHEPVIVMHNDAVIQGLSEVP
jgi:hypothetical protein